MKLTKINFQELQKLAEKIQLEIKEEEVSNYLATFQHLTKSISKLSKTPDFKSKIKAKMKIEDYITLLWGKNYPYLTLSDLRKMESQFFSPRISQQTLKKNAQVTEDGFIFYPITKN